MRSADGYRGLGTDAWPRHADNDGTMVSNRTEEMMAGRIESLRRRRDELDSKLRELAAKEARKNTQLDRRRKIILGAWLLKHRGDLVANIVANGLEREQDRRAFADWPTQTASAESISNSVEAGIVTQISSNSGSTRDLRGA